MSDPQSVSIAVPSKDPKKKEKKDEEEESKQKLTDDTKEGEDLVCTFHVFSGSH